MEKQKKRALNAHTISEKYRAMDKDIKNTDHAQELSVSELKILYKWRHGKNVPQKDSQKSKVLKDWLDRKDDPVPSVENWTTENENHLEKMKIEEIELNDTAVGRQI